MNKLVLYILILCSLEGGAQLSIDRQVISCYASDYSGSVIVSATAGQPDYSTVHTNLGVLTQGFHQPSVSNSLSVVLEVHQLECGNTYDVRVLSIDGCPDMTGLVILWNNIPGDMIRKNLPAMTTLSLTTDSGCTYTAHFDFSTSPVVIKVPCDLQFFNYVSPNGDGDNDVWIIKNIDTNDLTSEVKIFNRWGAIVWEGRGYDNVQVAWKGKSTSGNDLPDGTYYYAATIKAKLYNGYIELMR